MDIATLGLNVDSRQAATAVTVLDNLAAAGGRAEKSADKVTAATKSGAQATKGAASSYEAAKAAVDKFTDAETRLVQGLVNEYKQIGMNRSQLEAYRAAQMGMSKGAQELAGALGAQIDKANAAATATTGLGQATRVLGQALAALGIATTVRELVGMADAYTNINSRLGLVTSSTRELTNAQRSLFAIAQETRTGFADLVGTYAQMSRSAKEFGAGQNTMIGVTRTLSQAITISGASATSANAALVQLSQGFASGTLRGEELNSVMEQTPRVAQAIAEGMGITVGKLREMGQAGMLTASAVVTALQNSAASVDAEFGKMVVTVEGSMTRVSNSMLMFVGVMDEITGASGKVAAGISAFSMGLDGLTEQIRTLKNLTGGNFWFALFKNEKFIQNNLTEAREDLAKFEAQFKKFPNSLYIRANVVEARARVAELEADMRRLRGLAAGNGSPDPRDQTGYTTRSQSIANEQARQNKLRDEANALMLKASGVSATYTKEMLEVIRLNKEGVLVGDDYTRVLGQMQESLLKKTGVTSAANKAESAANKEARETAKLIAENAGLTSGFADDWDRLTKIYTNKEGVINLKALTEEQAKLLAKQPAVKAAHDAAAASLKEEAKSYEEAAKARIRMYDTMESGVNKLAESNKGLREEIELIGLTVAQQGVIIRARSEALILTKEATLAELQRQSAITGTMTREEAALKQEIELLRERNGLLLGKESRDLSAKAIERQERQMQDMWESVDRTAHDVFVSVADDGVSAFERIGKTVKASLLDMLYQMTVRKWVMNIFANVMGSGGAGGVAGQVAGAAGGGGIGNLLNMASMANTAYSMYGTGVAGWVGSGVGSVFGTAAGNAALGTTLGLGGSNSIAAANAASLAGGGNGVLGMGGAGSSGMAGLAGAGAFAAVAALVLNAMGAFKSERKVGGGLAGTLGSGNISPWEEWREGGTLFSGPSYNTFNPTAELDKARERMERLRATGDLANMAAQQVVIDNLEEQYGGLAAATAAQSKIIQAAYGEMRDGAVGMAEALGLSGDKARDFTTALGGEKGLNFDGLNPEEQQAKLAEALATANNEIAQQILGTWDTVTTEVSRIVSENIGSAGEDMSIVYDTLTTSTTRARYVASEYARDGEKAIDTLTRLSGSLTTVNTAFENLGFTLYETSLAGANVASQLLDALGGIENSAALFDNFYQNYYTEAERVAATTRDLTEQFAALGFTLPASREELRALIKHYADMGEAGIEMVAALLPLAASFTSISEAAESAVVSLADARSSAYSSLQKAVSAEKRLLQDRLSAAQKIEGELEGLFDLLHDNVRELRGSVEAARGMQARQGNEFIANALRIARATGYLPDQDELAEAIAAANAGLDLDNFGGDQSERDFAALVLAGKLEALEAVAGKQLTDAQKTVRELENQSKQLDLTLDYWQQQIDIANGTYTGVLSVEAAIRELIVTTGGGTPTTGGGRNGGTPSAGGGTGWGRTSYGADEALDSFDKFKAWYNGLRGTANTATLTDQGYDVPDWLRVAGMSADGTDAGMFGQYQFFKNNSQYAKDFEQIMTTGRSSYGTDGKTLIRSDLSKMPDDAAEYYRNNTEALLMAEGFLLDPVLTYQLYRDGPEKFGIDRSKISFTEWLRGSEWSADGVKPGDGADRYSQMDYAHYNLTKRDPKSGNLVGRDGIIYTSEGKPVGKATNEQMMALYGVPAPNKPQVNLTSLRQQFDQEINNGRTGQELADKIRSSNASMADVAAAYGISVETLRANLQIAGATDIPAYMLGTNYVPEDGPAFLHKGEAVIPREYNPSANGGGMSGEAGVMAQFAAVFAAIRTAVENSAIDVQRTVELLASVIDGNALITAPAPEIGI